MIKKVQVRGTESAGFDAVTQERGFSYLNLLTAEAFYLQLFQDSPDMIGPLCGCGRQGQWKGV